MKGKYIKKLVQKEDVKFFVIQESKKEMVDNNFCHSLWGHGDMEWLASPVAHLAPKKEARPKGPGKPYSLRRNIVRKR